MNNCIMKIYKKIKTKVIISHTVITRKLWNKKETRFDSRYDIRHSNCEVKTDPFNLVSINLTASKYTQGFL